MTASYKYLSLAREGGVVTCALANPPTHTLNADGVLELSQLCDEIAADRTIRVLVLTGADPNIFIRHYEVGELSARADRATASSGAPASGAAPDGPVKLNNLHLLCLKLQALDAITVAAINGNAAGGGCEVTLACDFRLMSASVKEYGLPETTVGIIPGAGGTIRLPRLLGVAKAMDLILHAKLLTPPEALEIGLVHRVYPAAHFKRSVAEFASDLAGRAPIALAAAKHSILAGATLDLPDALASEQGFFAEAIATKDAAGAMKAMLTGGTWAWTGQ